MKVAVTDHAAERYRERVKPMLDRKACVNELERLCQGAKSRRLAPEWSHLAERSSPKVRYLEVSDGVCCVVGLVPDTAGHGVVVTCIIRGGSKRPRFHPGDKRAMKRQIKGKPQPV